MKRISKAIADNIDAVFAFMAPIAVIFFVFVVLRIYPFGDRNIINSDLYVQFIPIMLQLKRAVISGEGILYSFNGGLGNNFYVLNTYQNASPLTWLFLLLFDEEHIVLCVTLLLMVKIGLSSLTMYLYLKNRNRNTGKMILISFSMMYSLCGYVVAYHYNLMWLECVMMLPLVIMGMHRVIDHNDCRLYVISLAMMLMTSYYVGLMMLVFIVLYFFIYHFSENRRDLSGALLRAAGSTILAIMMAMLVLLPSYLAIRKTGNYGSLGINEGRMFYYSFSEHISQLLPGSRVTITKGPANIYSGLITLFLCILYMFDEKMELRKRIIKTSFMIFIFLCTNFIPLDVMWQFGHMPNGFPNRYSFVLSFVMIDMAAEVFDHVSDIRRSKKIMALSGILVIYLMALIGNDNIDKRYMAIFGGMLMMLYVFAMMFIEKEGKKIGSIILSLVMIFELTSNTIYCMGRSGVVSSNKILYRNDEIKELLNMVSEADPYARLEIIGTDNMNAPYLYGYKGISVFASSFPNDTLKILNNCFKGSGNDRSFIYLEPSLLSDTLFGIDHYISIDKEIDLWWADEIAHTDNCYLYESRYSSSIAYMISDKNTSFVLDKKGDELLNDFIEHAFESGAVINNDQIDEDSWNKVYDTLQDERFEVDMMKRNRISGKIHVMNDGIFFSTIPYDDGWTVTVDGKKTENRNVIDKFISFPLTKGEHVIEMTYHPPGLSVGIAISLISLGIFIYVIILRSGGKQNDEED